MDMFSGSQDMADIINRWGGIAVATAPLGASFVARMIFGKSKMVALTVRISAGWMAFSFLSPHISQMHQTLTALINLIHGNGFQ
jgi:hypothetical protein